MGYEPTEYDHDPTRRDPNEPTVPSSPYINPYDIGPYDQLPHIPPPPPASPHRWTYILLAITVCVIIVAVVTVLVFFANNPRITSTLQTSSGKVNTPTDTPTLAPTPIPTIPYSAYDIYMDFYANHLGGPDPKQDTKWSCCTYFPEGGAFVWTADTAGHKLDIATFINNTEAETDGQQLAAQGFAYNVVHDCLLSFDANVPSSVLQPYLSVMATYCS
jgi:hypothetical protein